jgi:hypothetical protein
MEGDHASVEWFRLAADMSPERHMLLTVSYTPHSASATNDVVMPPNQEDARECLPRNLST